MIFCTRNSPAVDCSIHKRPLPDEDDEKSNENSDDQLSEYEAMLVHQKKQSLKSSSRHVDMFDKDDDSNSSSPNSFISKKKYPSPPKLPTLTSLKASLPMKSTPIKISKKPLTYSPSVLKESDLQEEFCKIHNFYKGRISTAKVLRSWLEIVTLLELRSSTSSQEPMSNIPMFTFHWEKSCGEDWLSKLTELCKLP